MSASTGAIGSYLIVATPALLEAVLPKLPLVSQPRLVASLGGTLNQYAVSTTIVGMFWLQHLGVPVAQEEDAPHLASRNETLVEYNQRHGRIVAPEILACL